MAFMTKIERDIQRKLRVLRHAEQIGNVGKACRYFGVGRASFYRWRTAFQHQGEAGLANRKTTPKNPANQTPPEIVEKVLHLQQTYHLGPIRIVWYLARYHAIKSQMLAFSLESAIVLERTNLERRCPLLAQGGH
jgi:transposase